MYSRSQNIKIQIYNIFNQKRHIRKILKFSLELTVNLFALKCAHKDMPPVLQILNIVILIHH